MDLSDLYAYADSNDIDVDWYMMTRAESLSAPLDEGSCVIAIDPTKLSGVADEKTKLSHELGHCVTGSFYNRYSPYDIRQRHENRADRWAIQNVLPFDDMLAAMRSGCITPWDLAERFSVTEDMIRKAYAYYTGPCGLTFDEGDTI